MTNLNDATEFVSSEQPNRRDFMKTAGALGLGAAFPALIQGANPTGNPLPEVTLGSHRISRLIVGSNQMLGYSHLSELVSQMMSEYFTEDRIASFLRHCEEVGIKTFQSSFDPKLDRALKKYREAGGKLQWICLANNDEFTDDPSMKALISTHHPIAIVHHGGRTDTFFRNKNMDPVKEYLKRVRDHGVLVGLSTHNPAVPVFVEENHWDIDLFMTCLHRVTRTPDELKTQMGYETVGEPFFKEDPPAMCKVIRQVKKPCLAFKILAAGRYCGSDQETESRFQFAFENIKKTDAVIVGMFPMLSDQAAKNAEYTRKYAAL